MNAALTRLSKLDTCAVSDALDQAKLPGAVTGICGLTLRKRIVGLAVTVQLQPFDGRTATRHLCTAAVESAGPGNIIVVAHGRTDVSGWGGILSRGAVHRGVEGVVIDGACRDLDESHEIGFPIYARGAVPVTARNRVIETDWNVPIRIGDVLVSPGDLVIADASGVVFVPASKAEAILSVAEKIVEREQLMADQVRQGQPITKVMGKSYEDLLSEQKL